MTQQNPIVLGNRGFCVFVNTFYGEVKIHVRKQFEDPVTGERRPTKYGTTLSVQEWNDLKSAMNEVDNQLSKFCSRNPPRGKNTSTFHPYSRDNRSLSYQDHHQHQKQQQHPPPLQQQEISHHTLKSEAEAEDIETLTLLSLEDLAKDDQLVEFLM